MKTFAQLEIHDFFIIQGDCGMVELMKLNAIEAMCINSCNGTYQKGTRYAINWDEQVIKTS